MTVTTPKTPLRANVSREEYQLLQDLRQRSPAQQPLRPKLTMGDRISDKVAAVMGSWPFIIIQSILLAFWVSLNVVAFIKHWDPYPFILLNLMLSFQAAYAAPIIMMSQNRQASIDRQDAQHDYEINMKAELEIELLHDKMNLLREGEVATLLEMLKEQQQQLQHLEALLQEQRSTTNPEVDATS
ncbi:DUF1003 domain-containing protein [Nodosilinea sp. LEGE 07088]|uniref:DUF1003 domain-containing protein n=1 Tax=Nodosilinea sp. LEGE 07088 TaxID=2777968 RepID=UPI00187F846D|nr:DUF1003 domain-containing protein [Nodosilinea sp. LEGE 07088]MBE9136008.1 DUF1003 domain-containing protein [Nodosilinea sp. LEGE 07088]